MLSLSGIIILYLVAILAGKRSRAMKTGAYLFLLLLAAMQTGLILFEMYNKSIPTP